MCGEILIQCCIQLIGFYDVITDDVATLAKIQNGAVAANLKF
jgi:hypothetical protein